MYFINFIFFIAILHSARGLIILYGIFPISCFGHIFSLLLHYCYSLWSALRPSHLHVEFIIGIISFIREIRLIHAKWLFFSSIHLSFFSLSPFDTTISVVSLFFNFKCFSTFFSLSLSPSLLFLCII